MSPRIAALAGGGALAVALTGAAAIGQEPARLIDGILGDGAYQTELPGRPEPLRLPELPDIDLDWEFDFPPIDLTPPAQAQPSGTGALADGLVWTLAIAAGVVLLAYLAILTRGYWDRRKPEQGEASDSGPAGVGPGRPGPLRDADALAQDGNWAEAIHMLLLDGLDQLKRRAGHSVPPAFTSRELMRRIALPDRQASAFAALVGAVERCHFGGRPAGHDEYQACRVHYRAFTEGAGTAPVGGAA